MNRNYQVGWWLIVLTIAMMFFSSYLISDIDVVGNSVVSEYLLLIAGELMFLVPIGLGALYLKLTKQNEEKILAIKPVPLGLIILSVLSIMGAQYFITYLTLPLQAILIFIFGAETATSQMVVPTGFFEFIMAFLTLCVVAPVVEEFLCRGILIKCFEKYGAAIAVLASSFAFAILHFEARSIIQLFFVGVLLGVFRVYGGSIIPCIVMHSVNNLMSLCQLTFFADDAQITLGICLFLAVMFVPVIYITFFKFGHYFKTDVPVYTKNAPGLSVGFFVCLGIFILYNGALILERLINL